MTTYQVDDYHRLLRLFQGARTFGRWQGQRYFTRAIDKAALEKAISGFVQYHHCVRPLTMRQRIELCLYAFEAADDYAAAQRPIRRGSGLMLGSPEYYSVT